METQKEIDADEYIKKHKIMELMNNMTSMLLFYRPEDPKKFLVEQLTELKTSQDSGVKGPNLFDSFNLDAIISILDPTNKRYITLAQYKMAMSNLGIKEINEFPEGFREDRITHQTFKLEASEGLKKVSETFAE